MVREGAAGLVRVRLQEKNGMRLFRIIEGNEYELVPFQALRQSLPCGGCCL